MNVKIMNFLANLRQSKIAAVFSNCGGMNRRPSRFAGNLLRKDLSEQDYLGIYHTLIFPNGVRKTTSPNRNVEAVKLVSSKGLLPNKRDIRILDVGASAGLDAFSTYEFLRKKYHIKQYILGDLHVRILYDPVRGLVFDEDGKLLQVKHPRGFVATNFSYDYYFQRFTCLPKRLRPWLLQKKFSFVKSPDLIPISLCHPTIDVSSPSSPFRIQRMNVFEPLAEKFDFIICMHLLVSRYFLPETIERGIHALQQMLNPSGALIVGALEAFRVITRKENDQFVSVSLKNTKKAVIT